MVNSSSDDAEGFPISDTLRVVDGKTIYRTNEWWKAFVSYRYEDGGNRDSADSAVYLWHNDSGDWKRKQKYLVRSQETWLTDREYIEEFLDADSGDPPSYDFDASAIPVNDYFTVGDAATVFKTDKWWKAVVRIDKKGDWTTREVVVYVWQSTEDEWRRRQKYAIKSNSDWEDEAEIISNHLDQDRKPEDQDSSFDSEQAKYQIQKKLQRQHIGEGLE